MPTFETQGGTSPGVTILNADGTVHTAHTTAGFTEAVTGSGVYNYPHPSPGTLLEFVFDATVGGDTLYASVWDDGLTTQGAAEAAIVAQDVSTFDPAADTVAHVTLVDTTTTNTDMLTAAAVKTAIEAAGSSIASILEDTGTTLPATLTTIEGKVDTVDTVVDAVLVDTGTTIPGTIATVDANVDSILVDTGTTIPAALDALPTAAENADAVWDEAISGHVTAGSAGRFLQRIYRYFFNKTLHTNTSVTVYADDDTTADATMQVSGDSSSVTKGAAS